MPELAVRSGSAPKDPPRTPVPEHPLIGTTPLSDSSPACARGTCGNCLLPPVCRFQTPNEASRISCGKVPNVRGVRRPRRARHRLAMASASVWPSASEHCVGARNEFFHGSIPSPPVPLSTLRPAASRPPTHDSGSGWIATPFLCGSFIRSFPPVYPGARSVPELHSLGAIRLVDTRNPLTRRPGSPRGWLVPRSKPRGRLPRRVRLPGPRR